MFHSPFQIFFTFLAHFLLYSVPSLREAHPSCVQVEHRTESDRKRRAPPQEQDAGDEERAQLAQPPPQDPPARAPGLPPPPYPSHFFLIYIYSLFKLS